MLRRTVALERPLDLRATLGPLRRGRGDRATVFQGAECWRATRTPQGAATLHCRVEARSATLHGVAWGPGADWVLDHLDEACGATDDTAAFDAVLAGDRPGAGLLRALHRQQPGRRLPATRSVAEALVPAILEQKVTGLQAHRSWGQLLRRFGEPAPGPGSLLLPPPAAVLAELPIWEFHRAGVERKRAACIATACRHAERLDAAAAGDLEAARGRVSALLQALPGIGVWTAAEVGRIAVGDPDALSVGDYHLCHTVVHHLTGRARGDDAEMVALLEPYRGHRARVAMLLESAGGAPRFGPKLTPHWIEAI